MHLLLIVSATQEGMIADEGRVGAFFGGRPHWHQPSTGTVVDTDGNFAGWPLLRHNEWCYFDLGFF